MKKNSKNLLVQSNSESNTLTENPSTDNETIKATTVKNFAGIQYSGAVNVKVQKNGKIIYSKKFHNEGTVNLFKFLGNTLAGNFYFDQRPCKIALYSGAIGDESSYDEKYRVSPYRLYDNTPVVEAKKESPSSEEYVTITYHFNIPYSFFSGGSDISIYKAALFNETKTDKDSIYAKYEFKKDKDTWEPIEINSRTLGNFSLIIDWVMSIKNNK